MSIINLQKITEGRIIKSKQPIIDQYHKKIYWVQGSRHNIQAFRIFPVPTRQDNLYYIYLLMASP